MSHIKKFFLLPIALFTVLEGFGQSASSPFSTFGIGERYGNALANNQGMGGTGVSQPQLWHANNVNPALLVFNTMTVFNAGIMYEQRKVSSDTISEKTKGGNLNYLVLTFPIKRNQWSSSLSLSPFSTVKYNLKGTKSDGTSSYNTFESGSGGISQLTWSNGVRVSKNVSVGLKANYLFGSNLSVYQSQLQQSSQQYNYYATVEERAYVKDFTFSAGVSFTKDSLFSRHKYKMAFGATYDFAANVKTKATTLLYRTDVVGTKGKRIDEDTLGGIKSGFSLPPGFTAGVSIGTNRWIVSGEFGYYDWTAFDSFNPDDVRDLNKAIRVAAGGEITPDLYGSNYLKRVTYRIGAVFEQLPYKAGNNNVTDLGMTLGVSLPAGTSSLDLGVKFGKRGNVSDNLIGENYFRLFFGVTINDRFWFIRRKFD
jgi:hypothetical protein